jgi:hypothetical protein
MADIARRCKPAWRRIGPDGAPTQMRKEKIEWSATVKMTTLCRLQAVRVVQPPEGGTTHPSKSAW